MSSMGLTWQDGEDVVPIGDFLQVMLRRLRAQSWNYRHAWRTSSASPADLRSALKFAFTHNAMSRIMSAQPVDSISLHYIIHPSEKLSQLMIMMREEAVATADDLCTLCFNDPQLDFAAETRSSLSFEQS